MQAALTAQRGGTGAARAARAVIAGYAHELAREAASVGAALEAAAPAEAWAPAEIQNISTCQLNRGSSLVAATYAWWQPLVAATVSMPNGLPRISKKWRRHGSGSESSRLGV